MSSGPASFGHVNLVASDWQRLATFYVAVFGCVPVMPPRDLAGPWLDRLTGLEGVRVTGQHFRLPGGGPDGPTLEIFSYHPPGSAPASSPDRAGFGHIAFRVADVSAVAARVSAAGGSRVGEVVTTEIAGAGRLTCCYVRDPEGNIIELQRWD